MRTYNLCISFLIIYWCVSCTPDPTMDVDIVIRGGMVNTGEGQQSYPADIGIMGDTIAFIGESSKLTAKNTIDARGKIVAPGFIDMHLHIERIFELPDLLNFLSQGITLGLGGPDGRGFWPFKSYLDSLSQQPLGANVAFLMGHNKIRQWVMDMDDRAPTRNELNSMKHMMGLAMEEGAFGMSTGLKYLPGVFANADEIIELAAVAAQYGGIYTSHLREEGIGLIEGVQEAIHIGHYAGIPVVLTHHKVVGQPMWGSSKQTLAMVDSARALGIDVMLDQYPYTASFTDLSILIPPWCLAGGQEEFGNRVQDPVLRDSILRGIEWNLLYDRGGGDLDRVQLASTPWDPSLAGKTLKFWAEREGLEPTSANGARLVLQAQLEGGGKGIYHAMDEEDLQRILRHPLTMIGSDGFLTSPDVAWAHPRSYGTYPRILGHYVREVKVIDLPTAIQKMTSMPADRLGLKKRGRLKVGNYADVVIFDPNTVKDEATFMDPHQYSTGIDYVVVNGKITIEGGRLTNERAGRVLRKTESE